MTHFNKDIFDRGIYSKGPTICDQHNLLTKKLNTCEEKFI